MSTSLTQKNIKNMKLLDKLVARKLDFDEKYQNVNMKSLVKENCQNEDQVKMLISGLEVLAKYCENLLNPQDLRPQKWLAISLHNQTFMEKVHPIKGHREILNLIGYEREEKGCLLFAREGDINYYIVAQIYLELKAIQSELRLWVEKRHPFPELFMGLLNSESVTKAQDKASMERIRSYHVDDDNHSFSISPDATLTNENATRLLRQSRQTSPQPQQQQQAPETSCIVQRRKAKGENKRDRNFEIYESDASRPATDPQVRRAPVYFNPNRSWGPDLSRMRSEIWICNHCTAENNHSERACRSKSRPNGDLASCPEQMPHTCDVCDKTTVVLCVAEQPVVVARREIKSMMPIKIREESTDRIGGGGDDDSNIRIADNNSSSSGDDDSNGRSGADDDYSSNMKKILSKKERTTRLLWNNRFQQFVKILHQQLAGVPEEEINYLFCQLQSKLSDQLQDVIFLDFQTSVMEIIESWKAIVEEMMMMLRDRKVYRDQPWGEESKRMVKKCLISNSGNLELALKAFLNKWKSLLVLLKGECFIPDLLDSDYSNTLFNCGGTIEEAKVCLIKNRYLYSIWGQEGSCSEKATDLYRDTRLLDPHINSVIKNREMLREKRVRILMCDCDINDSDLANQIVGLVDSSPNSKNLCIVDFLESLEGNNSVGEAHKLLMTECRLCCESKPVRSFFKLPRCDCTACKQCIKTYFEIQIKENPISSLVCPLCGEPKITDDFDDSDYFPFLTKFLHNILDENVFSSLGEKLTKWDLKDEKVATCPWDCGEQFIIDSEIVDVKVVKCPMCSKSLCTDCHSKWMDKNHSCGDKALEVGAGELKSCPRCRQAYCHVKGGCLHMICPNCSHQFCAECEESYHNHSRMGFHCQHPRNCLFYLRDWGIEKLMQLLNHYKITVPTKLRSTNQATSLPVPIQSPTLEDPRVLKRSESMCQSWVQKEDVGREEICGKDPYSEELGLCCTHYTEYLYKVIKSHQVDPVYIMDEDNLKDLLRKHGIDFPSKSDVQGSYENHLIKIIKDRIPLKRQAITSGPPSLYPVRDPVMQP